MFWIIFLHGMTKQEIKDTNTTLVLIFIEQEDDPF